MPLVCRLLFVLCGILEFYKHPRFFRNSRRTPSSLLDFVVVKNKQSVDCKALHVDVIIVLGAVHDVLFVWE